MVFPSKVSEEGDDAALHETMALRVSGDQGSGVLILSQILIPGYDLLAKYYTVFLEPSIP